MFESISSVAGHLFCYLNFLCHLGKNGRENYISISFFGFSLNSVLMSPAEFSGTIPGGRSNLHFERILASGIF